MFCASAATFDLDGFGFVITLGFVSIIETGAGAGAGTGRSLTIPLRVVLWDDGACGSWLDIGIDIGIGIGTGITGCIILDLDWTEWTL